MGVLRVVPPRYLVFAFAVSAAVAAAFGSSIEAQAQVQDLNIQSRIQTFSPPLLPLNTTGQQGVCTSDPVLVLLLSRYKAFQFHLPDPLPPDFPPDFPSDPNLEYFTKHPQFTADILAQYFSAHRSTFDNVYPKVKKEVSAPRNLKRSLTDRLIERYFIEQYFYPFSLCNPQQPTAVKASFPFNPDYESNVLKSNQNNSSGTSLGFGGTLQVTAAGVGPYDVIALSVGSASSRYNQYSSKSFDSVTTQGAYQFFINSYDGDGKPIDLPTTSKTSLPAQNMITVDTVALGFVNQTAYTTPFHLETTDLFTPQITFNFQNIPLAGGGKNNECWTASQDYRKDGFCYYANLSLTVGQTFSDVQSQQNANVAASVTPGWRIPHSDWNITLPAVATARAYENFPGGRDDVLLQVGPALTYTPDPFRNPTINTSLNFSLSATYNQNFSTVSAAAWHGFIIMPTLTVAFQPPPPPPPPPK
jgi:hypothetical protein